MIDKMRGNSFPLGAEVRHGGVNFSVFSKNADAVELLLFEGAAAPVPAHTIPLDPRKNRTYHYWHVFVPDIGSGQIYGYRVNGPYDPDRGMRFDTGKVLLDPYGKAVVVPEKYSRALASRPGDNCSTAMKSVVADPGSYDWEGDLHPGHPFVRTIIYEVHVQNAAKAAERYGGGDFACVLGQEMAGYATGEAFFVSQALGFRHSHLDAGGYSYDQKPKGKKVEDALKFLINDEKGRVFLTSMVSCLFARGVYTDEVLGDCLKSVGYGSLADNMGKVSEDIQRLRWKLRVKSGYRPENVSIPKRFSEITTWKGQVDRQFMEALKAEYAQGILDLAGVTGGEK